MLKTEKKALDEELNRLKQWYIPRLQKTKQYQKEIAQELEMIRQDAELLPQMFRHEAVFRTKCKQDKEEAEASKEEAEKKFNKISKEKQDLKAELERKERLALQAIAARGNMKKYFEEVQQELFRERESKAGLLKQMQDAKEDVEYYKKKHDEMFGSVSALNKRIDELEKHKLHLLEKLKETGDRSSLDYIVKTQGLDGVRGKELADKVNVENYEPGRK